GVHLPLFPTDRDLVVGRQSLVIRPSDKRPPWGEECVSAHRQNRPAFPVPRWITADHGPQLVGQWPPAEEAEEQGILSTKSHHILESGDRRTCRAKEVPQQVHHAIRHRGPSDDPDAPAVDAQWQGKPLALFELDAWSHPMS